MEVNTNSISTEASAIINVNFDDQREAEIAQKTLQVDPEPSRSKSKKIFCTSGKTLKIEVTCPNIRELRISLHSLLDHLHLVNQTMNRFGPTQPPTKKVCSSDQEQ